MAVIVAPLSSLAAQSPALTVHGRVVDTTGAVIVGADVRVEGAPHASSAASVTDEKGEFVLALATEGDRLTVAADGFESASVSVEGYVGTQEVLEVMLVPVGISQDVTVTATRVPTPVASLPNTVTVLENEAIRQRAAPSDDLASLLEVSVPGFAPSMKKLASRAESFRGRDPLYTVNGIPQSTPLRDGQRDSHTIDLDFLERVEVIHGANAIQGIGATGGIVNMVTKSPNADGSLRQDVKLSLASHDSFSREGLSTKLSYLAGKRVGPADVMGGVSYHKRGMFFDAEGDLVGLYATQGDIMDSTARDFYGKAGVDLGRSQRVAVTVNDFRLERDADYMPVFGERSTGRLTTSAKGDPTALVGDPALNDATSVSVEYRSADLFGGEAIVQAYSYDFRARFEGGIFERFALTPDGPPFLDQSAITSDKLGAKLSYALRDGRLAGFSPTVGLDVTRDDSAQGLARTNRVWVPPVVLHDVAPFFQVQRPVSDRVLVSGGLRLEAASLDVDDFTTLPSSGNTFVAGGSPSFTDVLPNLGIVVYPTRALSVYSSFSEGFTMPDVGRVLRAVDQPGQDVDTFVDIEPVVTNNLEIGIDYRGRLARLHADYYQSDADRGAVLDSTLDGIFQVRRQKTAIDGADFLVEVPLSRAWLVGGTFAWIRGRFDSDRDDVVDSDLEGVNIAPNRLNAYVQGIVGNTLSGRLQVSTLLPRTFRGPGVRHDRDFGGYTTADLSLAVHTRAGTIRLGVENLLDKQYVTYFSQTEPAGRDDTFFAGPGRGFLLTIEPRF